MVALVQAEIHHLKALLEKGEYNKIDKFILTKDEEVAPKFLLEFAINKLVTDVVNAFWWTPRLILVEQKIVGMIGFKGIPKLENDYSIEIGYGIVPSQRKNGFATEAVKLILEEAFSVSKIQTVVACTHPSNKPSHRVLEKNGFIKEKSKIDLEEEIWVWKKTRS
jgi:RimJ/RimL family protein N-acetyltransferase